MTKIRQVQQQLVGTVIGNRWWERIKDRIRSFIAECSQRLSLDKVKLFKDSLSRVEDSLGRGSSRQALEREAKERFHVR